MALRLLCLPLDDRPCNTDSLKDLAACAGIDFRMPPEELFATHGNFDFEKIFQWLDFQLGWNDAAIISVDMYLYGGLVRSRKNEVSESEVRDRLSRLNELFSKHSTVKIYLSCVLLRLSITVNAAQTEENWRDIFEYSVLADKLEVHPELAPQFLELRERIPQSLLAEYLAVRKRNASASHVLLESLEKISYIAYGQEDCAPFGLHRKEKIKLAKAIELQGASAKSKVTLCTGADELASQLMLRAFMDSKNIRTKSIPLYVPQVVTEKLDEKISKYEDITILENLRRHLEMSPFYLTEERTSASVCMHVLTFPESGQQDVYFASADEDKGLSKPALETLDRLSKGDALLDLRYANGAWPKFMEMLAQQKKLETLSAFSAWNTTGNSIGTVVAHLGFKAIGGENYSKEDCRRYLLAHFLDDWLYQSVVRAELQELCKEMGENPWALTEAAHKKLDGICREKMQAQAQRVGLDWGIDFLCELPWPRVFEVRILWN